MFSKTVIMSLLFNKTPLLGEIASLFTSKGKPKISIIIIYQYRDGDKGDNIYHMVIMYIAW